MNVGVYGDEYYRRGKHDPLPEKGPLFSKKNFWKNFRKIDYLCKMDIPLSIRRRSANIDESLEYMLSRNSELFKLSMKDFIDYVSYSITSIFWFNTDLKM